MGLPRVFVQLLLAVVVATSTVQAREYIYLPQPVEQSQASVPAEGVLVREVTVRKRDNLARIAKRHIGNDEYYPQILLFNKISNPRLIHPGDILRVPVSAGATKEGKVKKAKAVRDLPSKSVVAAVVAPSAQTPVISGEQDLYARALLAVRQGNCRAAVDLFDDFMNRYPRSALLADVTLNRAECYLKLSSVAPAP